MSSALLRASLFGLGIMAVMNSPAAAFKRIDLPGTRSKDYIKDLCGQVGGQYSEGQGQYGCTSNCGEEGRTSDACGINCSEESNKCYGWNPGRTRRPDTATGILLSGTASARSHGLLKNYQETDIKRECAENNGAFYSSVGGFGCATTKGHVDCTRERKQPNCTGTCARCRTTEGHRLGMSDVLTNGGPKRTADRSSK